MQDATPRQRGGQSIARNAGYLLGSQLLMYMVRLFYTFGLAYYLGPKLYGLFSYGQSWYLALLPLTGLGFMEILSREIGRDRRQGSEVVAQTWTLLIPLVTVLAVGSSLAGWWIEDQMEVRWLILIFSAALMGQALSNWTAMVFMAYEATQYAFRQGGIFRPLDVACALGALLTGYGVMAVASIHAISWWVQSLQGIMLIRRHFVPVRYIWQWRPLWRLLRQGLPIAAGIFCVTWLLQGPLVIFRLVAGEQADLGELALAIKALIPLSTFAATIPAAALSHQGATRQYGWCVYGEHVTDRLAPWCRGRLPGHEFRAACH